MTAHRAIESVTLDKETMHKKDEIMPKYAELIYNGYWYSKARFKLQKIVDLKRNKVNGSIKLKLYKGNITIVSRQTKSNAYSMKKVSFEENKTFNKSNVERFINFIRKNFAKTNFASIPADTNLYLDDHQASGLFLSCQDYCDPDPFPQSRNLIRTSSPTHLVVKTLKSQSPSNFPENHA